jgi:tRNA(adenine34) deaminase
MFNNQYMLEALKLASKAYDNNEVPVGAVIVQNRKVIASAHNFIITNNDPTAHAEMEVIKMAAHTLGNYNLEDCDLYVTLEPCPMCAYAIALARIKRLYFGAEDLKRGAVINGPKLFAASCTFHKPEIYSGIMESECSELLKSFFAKLR